MPKIKVPTHVRSCRWHYSSTAAAATAAAPATCLAQTLAATMRNRRVREAFACAYSV